MMTLKQIQTFHSICRAGGFSAAAERLNSTQTAVSMRIRELEAGLGVELFDRSRRTARLTAKGREFLRHAEQVIALVADIETAITNPHTFSGTVRLGASDFVAVTWLPRLVAAIHEMSPDLSLELDVDLGPNVFRKLEAGEVEVAILPGPLPAAGYSQIHLGDIEFAWMASSALNIPKKLSAKDLAAWPLLSLPPHSNSYRILDRWFEANAAQMRRTHVCNNMQVLMSLTKSGLGVSHLPLEYLKDDIKGGLLSVLDIRPPLPRLPYYVAYDRRYASATVKAVAEIARMHSGFRPVEKSKRRIKNDDIKRTKNII